LDSWLEMAVPLERRSSAHSAASAALCAGDLRALAQLYDEHQHAVRAFARRLVGEESAEDLVHDTFLSLPKALQRWNGESSLRTFLIGIAVNHARHHVRAAIRRRAAMQRWAQEPHSAAASPHEQLDQQRLSQMLIEALDRLSFDHRTAFVLCDVEERSAAEAAGMLAIPEATVRTRLFHARKKLRAALQRKGLR
jgi:RNA polymerase sigma-70 factor, ECF subfamily